MVADLELLLVYGLDFWTCREILVAPEVKDKTDCWIDVPVPEEECLHHQSQMGVVG